MAYYLRHFILYNILSNKNPIPWFSQESFYCVCNLKMIKVHDTLYSCFSSVVKSIWGAYFMGFMVAMARRILQAERRIWIWSILVKTKRDTIKRKVTLDHLVHWTNYKQALFTEKFWLLKVFINSLQGYCTNDTLWCYISRDW